MIVKEYNESVRPFMMYQQDWMMRQIESMVQGTRLIFKRYYNMSL